MTAPPLSLHPERLTQPPVALDVRSHIEYLFALQKAHAPRMARTTVAERRERLRRLRSAIESRRAAVYNALLRDLARPPAETELSEMHITLVEIDHAIRKLRGWMRGRRLGSSLTVVGTTSRLVYEPRGVALILAPWNYPFHLALNPLTSAIAAGCCVILKPSEKTPATEAVLRELLTATFPQEEVAIVEGAADVAATLLEQPFDHIHFTGGTSIARRVMASAAKHLSTVTLELGGKSPAIVDATADVPAAAARIVAGKFLNAGQTCIAPDYVLVHASRTAEMVEALKAAAARGYGADDAARRATADFGRIVDPGHFERLRELFNRTVAAGAHIAMGGEFDAATRYVAPTILTDVPLDSPAMQEEIFGPILPVVTWEDEREALRVINGLDKPLMMYVFTRDHAVADRFIGETSAGGTVINNVGLHYVNHDAPFGGVGDSGMGACHGFAGFRSFSHERTVMRQHWPVTIGLFAAPYGGMRTRFANWLLRTIQRLG